MANTVVKKGQEVMVPENLRKQLAVTVKSIQWSYAIFWSLEEQGVLQWGDGYYNGDIKTRETMQAVELTVDKTGLQRSAQLRELYNALLEGETERPSASLSPEDLTEAEWYYLVCMSFVFHPGQSLPGRALANGETIWLCIAQYADSKVFSRSLLAKSASVQTVVCFPHFGGVIEFGTTDLVVEDLSLIQHIKASLLDFSKPLCTSETAPPSPHGEDDSGDPVCAILDQEIVDTMPLEMDNLYSPTENTEYRNEETENDCSSGCEHTLQTKDSLVLEGLQYGVSLVQSCQLSDNELKRGVQASMCPSECISQALDGKQKVNITHFQSKELEEGNDTKFSSLDLGENEDIQYLRTLSLTLGGANQLIRGTNILGGYKSSFVTWKKGVSDSHKSHLQQNVLKKILFVVPSIHTSHFLRSNKEIADQDCLQNLKSLETTHETFILSGYDKENAKFRVLRSMVPSIGKLDKELALDEMVKYLKELEARVEELESCMDSADHKSRPRKNYMDMVEQISDNYHLRKIENGKQSWINKRKACNIDDDKVQLNGKGLDKWPSDVNVSVKGKEVQIQMRCPYREYILLDIMDEINKLYLDAYSVQSSTTDGILYLTLESKFQGSAVAPVAMIKRALRNSLV